MNAGSPIGCDVLIMTQRLSCLGRRHQWHNGWDEDEHQVLWTCKRCGKERRDEVTHVRGDDATNRTDRSGYLIAPPGGAGGIDGGGFGGGGGDG